MHNAIVLTTRPPTLTATKQNDTKFLLEVNKKLNI